MTVTRRRSGTARRYQGTTPPLPLLLLPTQTSDPRQVQTWSDHIQMGTKRTIWSFWHKPRAKGCCLGSLHPNQPVWDKAVDVSGQPDFSTHMSLPMLEADPSKGQEYPPPTTLHTSRQGTDCYQPDISVMFWPGAPRLTFGVLPDSRPRQLA